MYVRIRAILVIVLTNLLIIGFSVLSGITYVRVKMENFIETDMMVVADIADKLISAELDLLRQKALSVIQNLAAQEQANWPVIFAEMETLRPQFIGLTAFDSGKRLIASLGAAPASAELANDESISHAFLGRGVFTSTCPTENGVVFYLAVPSTDGQGGVLVFTIPGGYFSEQLSSVVFWETGHIFVDDREGNVIANIRTEWVEGRTNFIRMAQTDSQYSQVASVITRAIQGNTGIGRFSLAGIPRICAYRPISGSEEGWVLGIIAPLPESPLKDVDEGLYLVAFISFLLGIVAALIASDFIRKPFEEVAALKETAESNSQAKSIFLANMSHELRTPLNVVIGLTGLVLEETSLPDNVSDNIVKINSAGNTLLSIVNDILDFSKIESGKLELAPTEYYMSSLLNDVITLVTTRLDERPITFNLNISDDLPGKLYGDDLRVKQIFNNLLSNSLKYTQEGSIELSVNCTREGSSVVWMEIAVSDTGIGIREENIKKLFSDYYQVDTHANRKIKGTGLGLSITKKLVELMDGQISAESEYGKGSIFHLRIRQGFVNDTPIGHAMAENLRKFRYSEDKLNVTHKLVRPNLDYVRVLVVDDMQTNLDVAAGLLRKYKMRVDCLLSAHDALERMRGKPVYSAIFMDHMMPGMDGIEATNAIRAIGTEYAKNIPIIALTANAIHGTENLFYEHGFQGFISKPIDVMELDAVIKKWVRNQDKEDSLSSAAQAQKIPADENMKITIPGLDTEKGLSLYAGDTEIYVALLRSYALNTPKSLDKLSAVTEETLPDYIIAVHGLKGTSASVGAEILRAAAMELEHAGRTGNISLIFAKNESLIAETKKTITEISLWLEKYDREAGKSHAEAPSMELLKRLKESCENYDMTSIDAAMTELESMDYTEGMDLVVWLKEKINISEFTEVVDRLAKYQEEKEK